MGACNSKSKASGKLRSASCPPINSVVPPPLEDPKKFKLRVPLEFRGSCTGKIPQRPNGKAHVRGDGFKWREAGGMKRENASRPSSTSDPQFVQHAPSLWSTVNFSQTEDTPMKCNMTGQRLQEAQECLIE